MTCRPGKGSREFRDLNAEFNDLNARSGTSRT
jgi:hypothetical protein